MLLIAVVVNAQETFKFNISECSGASYSKETGYVWSDNRMPIVGTAIFKGSDISIRWYDTEKDKVVILNFRHIKNIPLDSIDGYSISAGNYADDSMNSWIVKLKTPIDTNYKSELYLFPADDYALVFLLE